MNFKLPSGIFISKTNSKSSSSYVLNINNISLNEIFTVNYCNLYMKNAKNLDSSENQHKVVNNKTQFYVPFIINNIVYPHWIYLDTPETIIEDNFYSYEEIHDNLYNIYSKDDYKLCFDKVRKTEYSIERSEETSKFNFLLVEDFISKNQKDIIDEQIKNLPDMNSIKIHIVNKNELDESKDGTDSYKLCILHFINKKVGWLSPKTITTVKFMGINMRVFPN